jgi:xanthine dehydrogenase YagR molybdenum-binding subunit
VQSTIPAGTLLAIDAMKARSMPGVIDVITHENAEKLREPPKVQQAVSFPLLQSNEILFNGQHIAIVVADTLQQAQEAAASVTARYRPADAIVSMDGRDGAKRQPKQKLNGKYEIDSATGDVAAAFAAAPVKIKATYQTPVEHHNAMEPHATIAKWDGDHLTVWTATQSISGTQQTLAGFFGLAEDNVTVVCPYVGGGFGSKGNTWSPATLAAMAARHVKRPVKIEITREQMFFSNGYRPQTVQNIELGAEANGKLTALRHDGILSSSMPDTGEFVEPVALISRMLYACPSIATSHRLIDLNQGLPTYMRAPGEASGSFALESAMDELAVALKMDPIALRMRNLSEAHASEGTPFASKPLEECYTKAAKAFGWGRRTPEPRSMRSGRMLVGMGMATTSYPTNRMKASAEVSMLADGTVLVRSGTQDIGTGTYTTMAQVAAQELGVSPDKVRVELGDSRLPKAPVSGGSMTSASVLPAVQEAAIAVREELMAMALSARKDQWHNVTATALKLENGAITGPNGQVDIGRLMDEARLPSVIKHIDAAPPGEADKFARHAFGAQFVEVHVDPDFGKVQVKRWVGAFDVGRVINAKTARSQLIGGIIFGIGMALMEETRTDRASGRFANANIAEYLVPVNADIPDIETIFVETGDPITTKLGIKGIGELPTVGAAAAIANAVYHATGKRIRDLPIRLEKVMA